MKKTLLFLISFVFVIASYSQDWAIPVSNTNQRFRLTCFPNPIIDQANFSFDHSKNVYAEIRITDLQGNLVAMLVPIKNGKAFWNFSNRNHAGLRQGIYLAWLIVEDKPEESVKIVKL